MSSALVEAWEDGAAFYIKAHAGARRDRLNGVHDGMIKVEVTTAPEKGKANKAIVKLLAKTLELSPANVIVVSGDTSQKKRIGVRSITPEQLGALLDQALRI